MERLREQIHIVNKEHRENIRQYQATKYTAPSVLGLSEPAHAPTPICPSQGHDNSAHRVKGPLAAL